MANRFIIREKEARNANSKPKRQGGARGALVGTIMGDVERWRKWRDGQFEAQWDEFYAKWRGFWRPEDKTNKTERSKLISPLTSMSVDLTVAEIVEAIFVRDYVIDLPDDYQDQQRQDTEDVAAARNMLVEDLKKGGFVEQMGLIATNGALYGTGICKIAIGTRNSVSVVRNKSGELSTSKVEIVDITPVAVEPGQFVGDPSALSIDDMKGCAHEFPLPVHKIHEKQLSGAYYDDVDIRPYNARRLMPNRGDTEEGNVRNQDDSALITEWYGLVPVRQYLAALAEGNGSSIPDELLQEIDEREMVEVIATIANEGYLLRVIENPNVTGERLMVAYQHESVPGRFWGRGVCEKGSNVQRAMDAEMRGRIDALAWSNHPMFSGDLTRLPPGTDLNAWPGKFWGTRGNPNDVLKEFRVNGPDPNSFAHMQDLERMGQQATGALDSIMSLRAGVRDETATGSALSASGFIKRSKRTMYNIEGFMNKLVRRVLHLKMRFEPEKYPQDYEFQVRGTIGIMAREIEQQFLTNLVGVIGPDSPAAMPIIRAIFEHSGGPAKNDVLKALRAIEEREPTPEERQAQQAALLQPVAEFRKTMAEVQKILAEAGLKDAQEDKTREEADAVEFEGELQATQTFNDLVETFNQARQLDLMADRNDIEREKIRKQSKK